MKRLEQVLLGASVLLGVYSCTKSIPASDPPGLAPIQFQSVEDNLAHDTLLIQATFNLGDGSFVMVASNVEDTWEGLRLYRYRPHPDSTADMMAISVPAYDSWTMLPTFFGKDSTRTGDLWVLANFGERESWGQKLFRLRDGFEDLGFIDAAAIERVEEEGGMLLKRRNIAPHARLEFVGDSAWIRFACDSVYLYDDQRGGYDYVIAASSVKYLSAPEGLSLWVNGEKREVKKPG
ncbi:MAG TPA: hypothetical protein PKY96_13000 [Flavobacteriales bacterium]|nr:hypothetical protein [Flavobacteriales bacterium]